jgi:hypothetical protein
MTLIEVAVAVTVLGIVLGAITTALILFFTSTQETTERLAESPEMQIASTYLTRDAQSGQSALDNSRCASSAWTGQTHFVSFGWREPGSTTSVTDDRAMIVTYVVAQEAGSFQKELRRYACEAALTTPGATFPTSISTATDTETVIAFVAPDAPVPSATVTSSTVGISLRVCTASTSSAVCKQGTGEPFNLTVSRRTA